MIINNFTLFSLFLAHIDYSKGGTCIPTKTGAPKGKQTPDAHKKTCGSVLCDEAQKCLFSHAKAYFIQKHIKTRYCNLDGQKCIQSYSAEKNVIMAHTILMSSSTTFSS